MHFPVYIYILIGAIALFLILCILYLRVYQRRINAALNSEAPHRPLPPPFHVAAALTITFLLLAVILSFIAGFGMGYRATEAPEGEIDIDAFYAQIVAVDGETLIVEGSELNRAVYRGELTLQLYPGLPVEYGETITDVTQLQAGDTVCILLLTDVTGIEEIFKIQIL